MNLFSGGNLAKLLTRLSAMYFIQGERTTEEGAVAALASIEN